MKPSTLPFESFLAIYGRRADLSRRSLALVRPVIDRLGAGSWTLAQASEIDATEALAAFNLCFGAEIGLIAFVSREELRASPGMVAELSHDMVPVDGELLVRSYAGLVEARMKRQAQRRFDDAMMRVIDPEGESKIPTSALIKDVHRAFADGIALSILASFTSVAVAAIGDEAAFDRLERFMHAAHDCLFLGFKDVSCHALLALTA